MIKYIGISRNVQKKMGVLMPTCKIYDAGVLLITFS